jgi:hypothetical protein
MNLAWCLIVLALVGADDPQPSKSLPSGAPVAVEDQEVDPMQLRRAIGVALANSEFPRVIFRGDQNVPVANCFGCEPTPAPKKPPANLPIGLRANDRSIIIAPFNADTSIERFKGEVIALVSSVEQRYWNLGQAHVRLWCADRTVTTVQEVLIQEQEDELALHSGSSNVAEVAKKLRQLQLELTARTSDVIASERELRKVLGLHPADNFRIIPVTPPETEQIVFDWDDRLLGIMKGQHDDIPQQMIHNSPHLLARLVFEVDTNFKQYVLAKKLTAVAKDRLDAEREYYDEGRTTTDRFLEAISLYVNAVAAEAQDNTAYNISLASLSEAEGTILADHNIVVVEGPRSTESSRAAETKKDDQTKPANRTSTQAKP